jgi:hypothetical protein
MGDVDQRILKRLAPSQRLEENVFRVKEIGDWNTEDVSDSIRNQIRQESD